MLPLVGIEEFDLEQVNFFQINVLVYKRSPRKDCLQITWANIRDYEHKCVETRRAVRAQVVKNNFIKILNLLLSRETIYFLFSSLGVDIIKLF